MSSGKNAETVPVSPWRPLRRPISLRHHTFRGSLGSGGAEPVSHGAGARATDPSRPATGADQSGPYPDHGACRWYGSGAPHGYRANRGRDVGETSRHRAKLTDMAVELAQKAAGFRRSLPESLLSSLANLVRAMNCYYSNLIEGHYAHPVDIERALKNDYSKEAKKRDLQLEAKAHIAVQEWIDGGGLNGRATTEEGIRETHKRFCELLPEDLLWVEDSKTKERVRVEPGGLRRRDVVVGTHVAVSAGAVLRFLGRFSEVYGDLNKTDSTSRQQQHSPDAVDSPVSRRKRACGASYVARHASRESRHRCGVVGCERTGSKRRSLQAAFAGLRPAAAQRSRWPSDLAQPKSPWR